MSRILLFLITIAVVLIWLKRERRRTGTPASRPEAQPAQNTWRCAQCGVYVGESEVVRAGERTFCCAEHRDAFAKSG